MSAYRKVNNEMIPVTTEGHPQYYFDTQAQAEAALSQLEEGADVFIKEGSNEDLLPRVEQAEEDIAQINNNLSDMYKVDFYSQWVSAPVGITYTTINKKHNGMCIIVGYSSDTADGNISDCSIKDGNAQIRTVCASAMNIIVTLAEFYL